MTRTTRPTRRRRRGERGAILLELVIVAPLLLAIILGVFDLGLAWRTSITLSNATRSGARVASNLGVSESADLAALQAIAAALSSIPASQVQAIVIYRATTATGDVPPECVAAAAVAAGGDASRKCNTYSQADYVNAQNGVASFVNSFTGSCGPSRRDYRWCPMDRENDQGVVGGPDYVGVYVKLAHQTSTKMFGSTLTIDDKAVMRIEPAAGNS